MGWARCASISSSSKRRRIPRPLIPETRENPPFIASSGPVSVSGNRWSQDCHHIGYIFETRISAFDCSCGLDCSCLHVHKFGRDDQQLAQSVDTAEQYVRAVEEFPYLNRIRGREVSVLQFELAQYLVDLVPLDQLNERATGDSCFEQVRRRPRHIILDTRGSPGDYPRGSEVYVSFNGKDWGKPVLTSKPQRPITRLILPAPVRARFIKIVQTGSTQGLYWSIHNMRIVFE